MTNWHQHILHFYEQLSPPVVPENIDVLQPHSTTGTVAAMQSFYKKYYNDSHPRMMLIGINPGRFGAGVTGIPFTDPIRLTEVCGIPNDFEKRQELSSVFIYQVIEACGGADKFFGQCYITSVSPLGFTFMGKNINYYDRADLQTAIEPFAVKCMHQQLLWPLHRHTAICIGEGKNFAYLQQLNRMHGWFMKIVALPHPRFIMQYKRRQLNAFVAQYADALQATE